MGLVQILKADAGRQRHFGGAQDGPVSFPGLLRTCLSPRFGPVLLFRLASWCARHHLRPIGKVFSMMNFILFGLEIAMDCEIGPGLFLPHTSGTVLGAWKIGRNAVIHQNVTLGAKVPDFSYDPRLRPELGDEVFVGAGAKILGGIRIGDRAVVGANAVVLESVPDGCLVGGIPAKVIPRKPTLERAAHEPERAE